MYAPGQGRFLQVDPLSFDAGDPNLYRNEGNNPVNYTDPMGLDRRKISDDFPAQVEFDDCYTEEQKGKILAAMRAAAQKINKAYLALRNHWDEISNYVTNYKPPGATKVIIPKWYHFLADPKMVGGSSPGIGGDALGVRVNNVSFYLGRFERILGELKNPNAIIPFKCGEANEDSGRLAYVIFNVKLFGLIKSPGNTIHTTDKFFDAGPNGRCDAIGHEIGRRSLGLHDENTGDFSEDVYEWDRMVDRLAGFYDRFAKPK